VWRWDQQEPFGVNVPDENPSGLGAFEFPLRFPGQYADKEDNLTYNYFRDYDPTIGRYAQSDPIGLRGGINTYLYVDDSPLQRVDTEGDTGTIVVGGIGGGAGAVGATGVGLAMGVAFIGGYAAGTAIYEQYGESIVDLLILATRGRWTCTAKCAHTAIPPNNCCEPPFLTGKGSGHSQEAACKAAKRDATTSAPDAMGDIVAVLLVGKIDD